MYQYIYVMLRQFGYNFFFFFFDPYIRRFFASVWKRMKRNERTDARADAYIECRMSMEISSGAKRVYFSIEW